MTIKLTVAEFFAQYAEKGHIFPDGGLVAKLRNDDEAKVFLVMPQYCQDDFPIMGAGYQWTIRGGFSVNDTQNGDDIIAVLDDAGNVIAGEV